LIPYGTDGTNLYQLFAQPDETLLKRYVSKRLRGEGIAQLQIKNFKRVYAEVDDNDGRGVSIEGELETGDGGIPGGVQSVDFELTGGTQHKIIPQPVDGHGIWGAIDLRSVSPDFTIERIHVAAEERTLFGA
jgi:hypothetical protein